MRTDTSFWRGLYFKLCSEVDQVLGKALKYPYYSDDQKNFPGTTPADGVCTGEHVPESLLDEAAKLIEAITKRDEEISNLKKDGALMRELTSTDDVKQPGRNLLGMSPPPVDLELQRLLDKAHQDWVVLPGTDCTETMPVADKNTPESLMQLRWAIYELIENYDGDYGKTISGCLRQGVEKLFKEYTNS